MDEHLDRFYHSIELGGFVFILSKEQLKERLRILVESNGLKTGNIQFHLISHPDHGNIFIAWIAPHRYPSQEEFDEGVDLMSFHANRKNPHLKSTNLPVRLQANELIDQEDVYEILLVDDDDSVTEGSRSNIFFISGNNVYTPSLSLVLDGITRREVVKIASNNQIDVINTAIPFETIGDFDSAFLTSTSMKVLPVRKIDDHAFDPQNKMVHRLMALFEKRIERNLEEFSW